MSASPAYESSGLPNRPACKEDRAISDEIRIANLTIHPHEVQALADGRRVGFTLREFEMFAVLAERQGRVMRRAEIYELIWGGAMRPRDRAVDVLVRKVRAKLQRAAPDWRYIHTHFGIGYRFEPEHLGVPDALPDTLPRRTADRPAADAPQAIRRTDTLGQGGLSAPAMVK